MFERNKYNPKFSRDEEPWDPDYWQTGSTEPPKSRGGLLALLLILIIFLCGIITVLGILNVKLFTELNQHEEQNLSITVVEASTAPTEYSPIAMAETEIPQTLPETAQFAMALQEAPPAVDNIPEEGGMALQDIYAKNIPSVVSIACTGYHGSSAGTGVVLTADGYIVTNAHVVANAGEITVQLNQEEQVFPARLVGADEISDLAVLYIEAGQLTPAEFGSSDSIRVGDAVVAIGDPLGTEFRGTFTNGIVSGIDRDVAVEGRTMTLIQTNAALNSGNSGGPLINCYGQVIGINTMKIGDFASSAGVEGLGFAIPSATVKEIVDQLIHQGYVSGRPTLGIEGEALSTFYQHYYRMPAGLYITQVDPGSYAAYYGISPGDMVLKVDDERIYDMEDLNNLLYRHEVGDVVTVVIYRSGQQASVDLTLTEDKG